VISGDREAAIDVQIPGDGRLIVSIEVSSAERPALEDAILGTVLGSDRGTRDVVEVIRAYATSAGLAPEVIMEVDRTVITIRDP
jgi:hypothetical protein